MFNELFKNVMNLGIITEDDVKRLTAIELMMVIIERTNGLLNYTKDIDEKLVNLLENIRTTTIEELNKWTQDGTFDELINQTALADINEKINLAKSHQKVIRYTDGKNDRGAVVGVVANVDDDYQLPICGFRDVSHMSQYADRDSVALYVGSKGTNALLEITGSTIFTEDTVTVPSVYDLSSIKVGSFIDTKSSPRYTSIIKAIHNNVITVEDGWYEVAEGTGSNTPTTPPNGTPLIIGMVSKVWAINANSYLENNKDTKKAVVCEFGMVDNKTDSQTTMWGVDVVNLGSKKAELGYYLRGGNAGISQGFRADNVDSGFISYTKDPSTHKSIHSFYKDASGAVKDGYWIDGLGNVHVGSKSFKILIENEIPVFVQNDGSNTFIRGEGNSLDLGHPSHMIKDIYINGSINSPQLNINSSIVGTGNIVTTSQNGMIKTAQSDWDKGHIQMGGYHLWIDGSGKLRIKNGAPTSGTDGEIVGH